MWFAKIAKNAYLYLYNYKNFELMAKKKTTKKQTKNTKPLDSEPTIEAKVLSEDDRLKTIEKFNKLKSTETMVLPDEAIVNIPVNGQFFKAIDGLFYYLMDPLTASEIIYTMGLIKSNFEGKKPEEITNNQRAIWTVMTLLSEIHWQADAQGKLVKTDQGNMGQTIQKLLHGVEGAPEQLANLMELTKENKKSLEKDDGKWQKKEDSTEDSSQ